MQHVREQDVAGERMDAPYARVVKHLAAPWTMGTSKIWMGISVIEPLSASSPHAHVDQEEAFYCLSGTGKISVGEEQVDVSTGSCVFVPQGALHQLINTQPGEVLRILSATAPAFSSPGGWAAIHAAVPIVNCLKKPRSANSVGGGKQ
jgi:mannose-6-phosphate isomerase-like protein (cupin superfamily)